MITLNVKQRSRKVGIFLVTLLGCLSLFFNIQTTAYEDCGIDWLCQVVDSTGDVGKYTSLAIDAAGYAAISYFDEVNGDLKLAYDRNGNGNFSVADEITIVDDGGPNNDTVGLYTSLAFDASGKTAISYYDEVNGDLKLAYDRNSDGNFSAVDEIIIVDDGGLNDDDVGWYTSLDFGTGPAISYYDLNNRDLKLAYDRNNDGNFSAVDEIIIVDDGGPDDDVVGLYTSLAFDASGNPAISYYDWTNRALKLAYDRDGSGNFSVADEIITVDSAGMVGLYTSLAFGTGPAISYWDWTNGDLKFAYDRNNDRDFSDTDEIITVDNGSPDNGNVGLYTSLAFDAYMKPAISYLNDDNYDLKFAYDLNDNGDFSDKGDIITVDITGNVGLHTSLAFDGSGMPVISHYDATNDDLKLTLFSPAHPRVVNTSPEGGDTGVPVIIEVTATFNEAINGSTLDFTLDSVAGHVGYDEVRFTATFTPDTNLSYLTTYNARLSASDLEGKAMPLPHTWSFTTLSTGTCGDVNDDGSVNMADMMILWYVIADYPEPGAWTISNEWAADVNCDGSINMADVMILWYDTANYPEPGAWVVSCCE